MKENKKARYFDNFEEYYNYYEENEHAENIVDITDFGNCVVADVEFECRSWKTAIKRLAKITGWDWVLDELESSEHLTIFFADCDGVIVEFKGNNHYNLWYVAAKQHKEVTTV